MKRYYGKNRLENWHIENIVTRSYKSIDVNKPHVTFNPVQIKQAEKQRHNISETHRYRAIETIDDLPDLPIPIRKLTPPGRMYEFAKILAKALIVTDPLGLIED